MNVLDYLSKKTRESTTVVHPLVQHSSAFKYTYCFGLAVLVYGYKEQLSGTINCFSSILNSIKLDTDLQDKLQANVKHNFDLKISDVFKQIEGKREQYCFIADLYRIFYFGLISPTYFNDILNGYLQVFNFTNAEKTFFREFTSLAYETVESLPKQTPLYFNNRMEQAVTLYENFQLSGQYIPINILKYIFPGFSFKHIITDFSLDNGTIQYFESNLHIKGNLTISNCSTLIIRNAHVTIEGAFIITNGKIVIENSDLLVQDCSSDTLITIEQSPTILIEDSVIDCNNKCAFLSQNSGHLKIQQSKIFNTTNKYAICFTGNSADISKSVFENCAHGAFLNRAKSELFIGSTVFKHCYSEHGGAIHSKSLVNSMIYNCSFSDCHAKYIGGAIYFENLKFGQSVLHCTFEHCTPNENFVFNSYEKEDSILHPIK